MRRKIFQKKINMPGIDGSVWTDKEARWRKGDLEDDGIVTGGISLSRIHMFYLVSFLILLVFCGRLFVLTVVAGSKNRELADNNRVKLIEVEAPRGRILDRYGKVLAESQIVYILKKGNAQREISFDEVKKLEASGKAGQFFDGEAGKIVREVRRKYSLGEAAAHVLGYTSVVQAEEKERDKSLSTINSRGRLGVESTYNSFLTGQVGKRLIEVDAEGKNTSIIGEVEALGGRDVHVAIDGDLQKVAYEALVKYARLAGGRKGAVVIEKPDTGEILALASSPSYNPEDIGSSVSDVDLPFFNRAVQGSYPPGSVFKIITSLAGLESGNINRDTEFDDVGKIEVGGQTFSNWLFTEYGRTDGLIKIERAIGRSNDIFFYKAGEETGVDNIKKMAVKLGYGQKTGIDLPEEAFGLVPDEVWKKSSVGEDWFTGDTLHLAIGQGFMLTTPVQVDGVTSFIASSKLTKPYLVKKIDGGLGAGEINFDPKVLGLDLVKPENIDLVRNGMKMACEAGGTGVPFFNAKYKVACKTGTAEELGGESHAWFTVYAPVENPQVAISIVVERGGQGSAAAAPAAKEMMDWWMANRVK